jgi:hypothetical protein
MALEDKLWGELDSLVMPSVKEDYRLKVNLERLSQSYKRETPIKKAEYITEFTKIAKIFLEENGYKFNYDEEYADFLESLVFAGKDEKYAEFRQALLRRHKPDMDAARTILKDALADFQYNAKVTNLTKRINSQTGKVKDGVYKRLATALSHIGEVDYKQVRENPMQAIETLLIIRQALDKYARTR